jgi:hypothetical protein
LLESLIPTSEDAIPRSSNKENNGLKKFSFSPETKHSKDIHVPLVMLTPSSSRHTLVAPALPYGEPFDQE